MTFPIRDYQYMIPPDDLGSFGILREGDRHTGVDLYCAEGTPVYAVEDGVVVSVDDFTGLRDSEIDIKNRYLYTQIVMVEGKSGVVGYCEVVPVVTEGDTVKEGDVVAHVTAVLPDDYDGHRSMLHFELYVPGTKEPALWELNENKPEGLRSPTLYLKRLLHGLPPGT